MLAQALNGHGETPVAPEAGRSVIQIVEIDSDYQLRNGHDLAGGRGYLALDCICTFLFDPVECTPHSFPRSRSRSRIQLWITTRIRTYGIDPGNDCFLRPEKTVF